MTQTIKLGLQTHLSRPDWCGAIEPRLQVKDSAEQMREELPKKSVTLKTGWLKDHVKGFWTSSANQDGCSAWEERASVQMWGADVMIRYSYQVDSSARVLVISSVDDVLDFLEFPRDRMVTDAAIGAFWRKAQDNGWSAVHVPSHVISNISFQNQPYDFRLFWGFDVESTIWLRPQDSLKLVSSQTLRSDAVWSEEDDRLLMTPYKPDPPMTRAKPARSLAPAP